MEEWLEERKRLGSWRIRGLDSEKKLNDKIIDLETDYDKLKEKHDGLESKLEELKEHTNEFKKGLWQAAFFHKDIDAFDAKFDMNKDVVNGQLVNETESSPEEEVEKVAEEPDANPDEAVAVKVNVKQTKT